MIGTHIKEVGATSNIGIKSGGANWLVIWQPPFGGKWHGRWDMGHRARKWILAGGSPI